MPDSPSPTKLQLARKKLRYIFIVAAIAWVVLSAFLPPLVLFSLLDVGLFFMIWHGIPFGKFLTIPLFLIRGVLCLLLTLVATGVTLDNSQDAGASFATAMLPALTAFTVYSLGAAIALFFVPNIADIREAEAFSAKMRANMERIKAREASRDAEVRQELDGPKDIPPQL